MDAPGKLDDLDFELEEIRNKLQRRSTRDSLTSSDVTNCSETDDDSEKPLSHAEESAIEECLNDTEGSLSNVDLNIFDDISDEHVHRTKKTKGQRTFERASKNFGRRYTDYDSSSLDEVEVARRSSLVENSLNNPISTIDLTGKTRQAENDQTANQSTRWLIQENVRERKREINDTFKNYSNLFSLKNKKRIVRRKRKNSPPIKKNDKTHIYSFFYAMADLVSTLPDEYAIKAKQNVNIVLEDVVDKYKEWYKNKDLKNLNNDVKYELLDYHLVQDKSAKLLKNKDWGVITQDSI